MNYLSLVKLIDELNIQITEIEEGMGKSQVSAQVLQRAGEAAIFIFKARQREKERDSQQIAGQDTDQPALIERRRPGQLAARLRIGQIQQETGQKQHAVHPHIAAAQQKIQGNVFIADGKGGGKPALLPDMEPAHNERDQHADAVQGVDVIQVRRLPEGLQVARFFLFHVNLPPSSVCRSFLFSYGAASGNDRCRR